MLPQRTAYQMLIFTAPRLRRGPCEHDGTRFTTLAICRWSKVGRRGGLHVLSPYVRAHSFRVHSSRLGGRRYSAAEWLVLSRLLGRISWGAERGVEMGTASELRRFLGIFGSENEADRLRKKRARNPDLRRKQNDRG